MNIPQIRRAQLFDVDTVTRDQIVHLVRTWRYDSSEPYITGLLLQINDLKGFAPITIVDKAPDRTHAWEVLPCETHAAAQQLVGDYAEGDLVQYKYLGMHDSHCGKKYYVLSWVGREPGAELVRTEMKQHGARFE